MNKFAVTGASGFVGAYLCRALLAEGFFVNAIDNNLRGNKNRLRGASDKLKFYTVDVRDKNCLLDALKGCTTIFHLAAVNGTENFYNKPDLVLDVGIKGMFAVAEAAIETGVENLVVASSAEVYQTPKIIPTPEDIELFLPNSTNPRYSYGGSKIVSELIAMNFGRKHFKKVQIFRPHNVYGPDMGWKHVIPQFIVRIQAEIERTNDHSIELEIKGNGEESRSFCYVDDIVTGILTMAKFGSHREIYNIGNNHEIKIKELVRLIAKHMGVEIIIKNLESMEGSTRRRCPNIEKNQKLGYAPKIDLNIGLKKTINWYLENSKQKINNDLL